MAKPHEVANDAKAANLPQRRHPGLLPKSSLSSKERENAGGFPHGQPCPVGRFLIFDFAFGDLPSAFFPTA
jgi:hypothetical protein